MKKKIGIIIFIIALIVCVGAIIYLASDNNEIVDPDEENIILDSATAEKDNIELEKQLNIILSNKDLWYKDDEFDKYSYAVTDLDQNGKVEIISSICQGTGLYTYTTIYEVNETLDSLSLCESNLEEYDSQADIIKNSWPVFYDKENSKYYYIFEDVTRNGMAEVYENKRYFSLNNSKIVEEYLVRKSTIYENETPQITFTDVNDSVITEEAYNDFQNEYFADLEKMTVNIYWLIDYSEIGLSELENSYSNFKLTK